MAGTEYRDDRPAFAGTGGRIPAAFQDLPTPCYILDERALRRNGEILGKLAQETGCQFGGQVYGGCHAGYLGGNGLARDFFQRGHIGQKAPPGIAVVQTLLLRHIAQNTAEGNARCGLAAPKHFAGIGCKRTRDNVNQCGFARTVGTQQSVKARRQGE